MFCIRFIFYASLGSCLLFLSCKKKDLDPSTADRQRAISAYVNEFLPNGDDKNLWWEGGDVSNCGRGRISDENLQKAFNKVLYFRRQAGFSYANTYPVAGLSSESEDKAALEGVQQMALMVLANNTTAAIPLPSMKCYTAAGAHSARGFQLRGVEGIWINETPGLLEKSIAISIRSDWAPNVRHRQWLFSPYMKKWYGGATNKTVVVYWSELNDIKGQEIPEYVMWPPNGHVVDDLVSPYHWSLHILRLSRNPHMPEYFAKAEVRVRDSNRRSVPVDILHRDVGAHRGGVTGFTPTLVFRPRIKYPGTKQGETGDTYDVTYHVEITKIQEYLTREGKHIQQIAYDVTLMDGASIQ